MDNKTILDINEIVNNIIRSRYEHVDYSFINKIAILIIKHMKCPRGTWQSQGEAKIKYEELLSITKDFYESIDSELSNEVSAIIEGKSTKVQLNIKDGGTSQDGIEPRVYTDDDGNQRIEMFFDGNIFNVFDLTHELAHTLDMPEGKWNISRICLAEITSECIEKMFFEYAEKNDICSKKDIDAQKNNNAIRMYGMARDFTIKYAFMELKLQKGNLTETDIENLFRELNISYSRGVQILNAENSDIHHRGKYVLAGIASEQFEELYKENPQRSIEGFKKYIGLIKQNRGIEAIKELGIDTSTEGIIGAIQHANISLFPNYEDNNR